MQNRNERIREIISRMNCDIVVAIPRMITPTAEEMTEAFQEFNREKRNGMREAKEPLKISKTTNGNDKTFVYADVYKLKNYPRYMERFLEMCQDAGEDICLLGMNLTLS